MHIKVREYGTAFFPNKKTKHVDKFSGIQELGRVFFIKYPEYIPT